VDDFGVARSIHSSPEFVGSLRLEGIVGRKEDPNRGRGSGLSLLATPHVAQQAEPVRSRISAGSCVGSMTADCAVEARDRRSRGMQLELVAARHAEVRRTAASARWQPGSGRDENQRQLGPQRGHSGKIISVAEQASCGNVLTCRGMRCLWTLRFLAARLIL